MPRSTKPRYLCPCGQPLLAKPQPKELWKCAKSFHYFWLTSDGIAVEGVAECGQPPMWRPGDAFVWRGAAGTRDVVPTKRPKALAG
jgi:hypothetical protein